MTRDDSEKAKQATPHATLIDQLLDSRVPKTEREHAAACEIQRLREAVAVERGGRKQMNTTLNRIRSHNPSDQLWEKLLGHLGKTKADDEPLPLRVIFESNGLDDAIWCLRAVPNCDKETRLFAVWCARQVQHLMIDPRSLAALDVAERHVDGEATDKELTAARAAAWAAARDAARNAAWDAAWSATSAAANPAAWATSDAAWHAARHATSAAAWHAADVAAKGAKGAKGAAWHAAKGAAWQEQEKKFIEMFCQEEVTT